MSYKLAIFDLDGTVLDTLGDLAGAVNAALAAAGYPARTVQEVRGFVGNGIRNLIERIVPAGTAREEIDRVHELFTAYYKAHCADETAPYAGVLQMLADLRAAGVQLAVLSNKADYATQALCRQYFPDLFHVVAGERESEGIPKKPAPQAVHAIMAQCGASAAETVYIGDSEVDVKTAANAGLTCIAVTWGFRDRAVLEACGATTFADTTEQVKKLILA